MRCAECGNELGAAVGGLCPSCLLRLGLEAARKEGDESAQEDAPAAPAGEIGELAEGERVGPYKILKLLGQGGMGLVYLAEQEHPMRRRAALKIIKAGMDTREVIGRFESERQALALMSHNGVARVFDAGATDSGRPYFAMEYVDGPPITEYCDQKRLDTPARLKLFAQVCQAVQHAHQKGIIHRDLKPSNVLVEIQDGQPIPKVIDFGIAKAAGQPLTDKTVYTRMGAMIGTPEYMSPEQAELSAAEVDSRTDIYSLGVLLYELLTGLLPFPPDSLRGAGYDQMRKILREKDPPTPSLRLKGLPKTSGQLAASRCTDPAGLEKLLQGDLDWIAMKAMAKEPERRYASASELAADVLRHLEHQPVLAGPPGALYAMGKFVRRHRLGVAAAAAVSLALLAGITATGLSLLRARRAEQEAVVEAETAQQVSDFLVGLFAVSDPGEAQGNSVTARQILDQGAEKVNRELSGQPRVQSRMLDTMGRVYQNLGLYQQARPLLEKALQLRETDVEERPLEAAQSMNRLAGLLWLSGDYQAARPLFERSIEIREKVLGPDHPDLAESLRNLGICLYQMNDFPAALALFERSLRIREKALGPDHLDVASSLNGLAILRWRTGDYQGARPLYERALAIREKALGPRHPEVAAILNNLGLLLKDSGDYRQARQCFARVLDIRRQTLDADHPEIAGALNNIANLDYHTGDYQSALPLYEQALAIRKKVLPEDHPDLAISIENVGLAQMGLGNLAAAGPKLEQALQMRLRKLGPEHTYVADSYDHLAVLAQQSGEVAQAEELFSKALEIRREKLGMDHPLYAETLSSLGGLLTAAGRLEEARPLLEEALRLLEEKLGPDHPKIAATLRNCAQLKRRSGHPEEADRLEARARAIEERGGGRNRRERGAEREGR